MLAGRVVCVSKAQSKDKAPWPLPHLFLLPPPHLPSFPPAVSPASLLQRPPSPLAQASASPLSRHGLNSPSPLTSLVFRCSRLLPFQQRSFHARTFRTLHWPFPQPGILFPNMSTWLTPSPSHLPPVFTPTHTSYPPFPLFLLTIYHKHMFCTEYRLQENKDFLNACILSSRMASGSLPRERRGLCRVPRSAETRSPEPDSFSRRFQAVGRL